MLNEIKTQDELFNLIQNGKPMLVDFWAEWCGPCKMTTPIIEEIANEYSSTLTVVKVNVDEAPELAALYKIRSIPTIMIFSKDGNVVDQKSGAAPKARIVDMFQKYL